MERPFRPRPPEPFPTDAVPTCVASGGGHLVVADLAGRIWQVSDGNATIVADQSCDHYTGCAANAGGEVCVVSLFEGLFANPGTRSIVKVGR